jgi:hypothetical protein
MIIFKEGGYFLKEEIQDFLMIFTTARTNIEDFMNMLEPIFKNTQDEHERLYYHHIYEEEEQRLSRLALLIPLLDSFERGEDTGSLSSRDFNQLLQELNLEKFGLHNFVEHLDLALYHFKDEERSTLLTQMRELTYKDYQRVKSMLQEINGRFDHDYVDPHEHHDHEGDHLAASPSVTEHDLSSTIEKVRNTPTRIFTVGSLIQSNEGVIE